MFSLFDATAAREATEIDRMAHASARTIRGQMNIPARKQDEIFAFKDNVESAFAEKMQDWEAGGRVGPPPRKLEVAQQIQVKQRESRFTSQIEYNVNAAQRQFGPNGTIIRTNIDFEMIDLTYDIDGNAIGLDPDFEAALVAQGLTPDHIDSIRQYAFSIDRAARQRSMIR